MINQVPNKWPNAANNWSQGIIHIKVTLWFIDRWLLERRSSLGRFVSGWEFSVSPGEAGAGVAWSFEVLVVFFFLALVLSILIEIDANIRGTVTASQALVIMQWLHRDYEVFSKSLPSTTVSVLPSNISV